jgi:hypothetical protein
MRIRRTIIAPVILTIGALGSLVAAPAVAAMTSAAPALTRVPGQRPAVDSQIDGGPLLCPEPDYHQPLS